MVGSKYETFIGRPYVGGAKVSNELCQSPCLFHYLNVSFFRYKKVIAMVEEKLKDAKVIIFKKRRRKNKSQTLRGYRRQLVKLRICDIIHSSNQA
jgi:ribosomal protein L21